MPADPVGVQAFRVSDWEVRRAVRSERRKQQLVRIPLTLGLAATVLARLTLYIDRHVRIRRTDSFLVITNSGTASTIASTVAAAMLTLLGLVFTASLVAIQTASAQYSPRAVRVFLRLRANKISLGIFTATFIYSLLILYNAEIGPRDDRGAPTVSLFILYFLVLATLVALFAYIATMVRLLRVQYLLEELAHLSSQSLAPIFATPPLAGHVPYGPQEARAIRFTGQPGVLIAVDVPHIMREASAADAVVEIEVPAGIYLVGGERIGRVTGPLFDDAIAAALITGSERTFLQDPATGIRQMVDIAIKALSPAVNDPTTAVQAIDRLTRLLASIGDRPMPTGWFAGLDGMARLHLQLPTHQRLVQLAFTEIIQCGADSPAVVRRMRFALDVLGEREYLAAECRDLAAQLELLVAEAMPPALRPTAATADPLGLG